MNKPYQIEHNDFMSAKWDELTSCHKFNESDAPALALLCQWYAVVDKCMDDLDYQGSIQVAYQNNLGDLKALPQLSTLKQASAEIRALNKQLGINDEATPQETRISPLYVIQKNRQSKAENSNRAKKSVQRRA